VPADVPRVIVNLKTYAEATGERAVAIAEAMATVAETSGVAMAVAPQTLDVRLVMGHDVPVYAQHFDHVEGGSNTGWTSLEHLHAAGVAGSLVNHSEHRVDRDVVRRCIDALRARDLVSVVCTKDAAESGDLAGLGPAAVAVEPPELIGGEVSVTTADPKVVSDAVAAVAAVSGNVVVLCGAGVKTRADVEKAVELGAHGILLASGVTKAKDPKEVLEDLAAGFP
jgi:triosephosphate isomerase